MSHYHHRLKMRNKGLDTDNPVPFTEWVRLAYKEHNPAYLNAHKFFMPQLYWVADNRGELLVDFVGRFERLNEDFQHVCSVIGRDRELPHIKKSNRGDYRKYYDDDAAAIIEHAFIEDITAFGYTFDGK